MEIVYWLLASALGYLAGSLSGARIIVRLFAPQHNLDGLQVEVPGSQARFQSDVISATTVRLQLGSRYGCLTAILDMIKAALPALLFRFWLPAGSYYLAAAGMATVGHIWPLYHRFKGGRGMSPILGGMLVVDWLGVIVTQLIGAFSGILTKNYLLMIGTGTALMIPWTWFRTRSWPEIIYLLAMNLLFWYAMGPEVREFKRLKQEGGLEEFSQSEQVRIIGRQGQEITPALRVTNIRDWVRTLFNQPE